MLHEDKAMKGKEFERSGSYFDSHLYQEIQKLETCKKSELVCENICNQVRAGNTDVTTHCRLRYTRLLTYCLLALMYCKTLTENSGANISNTTEPYLFSTILKKNIY